MTVSCIFGKIIIIFKLKMDKEAYFSKVGEIEAQVNEVVLELKAKKGGGRVGTWVSSSGSQIRRLRIYY